MTTTDDVIATPDTLFLARLVTRSTTAKLTMVIVGQTPIALSLAPQQAHALASQAMRRRLEMERIVLQSTTVIRTMEDADHIPHVLTQGQGQAHAHVRVDTHQAMERTASLSTTA